MFQDYTTSGNSFKKFSILLIAVAVVASGAFFYVLNQNSARKSKASVGDSIAFSFTPATVISQTNVPFTSTIKIGQLSRNFNIQGYRVQGSFDKTKIQVQHIEYRLGTAAPDLADTDATLSTVNQFGTFWLQGDITSADAPLISEGQEVAVITYKVTDPAYTTSDISFGGKFVELKSDNTLASIVMQSSRFTVQSSTYTPALSPSPVAGSCGQFQDVSNTNVFHAAIQCLGCNHILNGYSCNQPPAPQCVGPDNLPYFLPNADIKRGETMQLIASAAKYNDSIDANTQTFQDVTSSNPFWRAIEQAHLHGLANGYVCGQAPAGPCVAPGNKPYFLTNNAITRQEATRAIVTALAYNDTIPTGQQTFVDVRPTDLLYPYVERAAMHHLVNGYNCASGDNCGPDTGVKYFRPNQALKRGEAAQIIATGYNCVLPPSEGGNTTLNMKLKFQGITARPRITDPLTVAIKVVGGALSQPITKSVAFTSDENGIWTGTTSFDLPSAQTNAKYSVYVKGPKHLKKRVCVNTPTESAPGTYACAENNMQLNAGSNTLDMSGIYMLTGDLPVDEGQQNGVVDSADTSYIRLNFGETDPTKLRVADLNMDGNIDTQDFSLVIAALGVKYDDPEQ